MKYTKCDSDGQRAVGTILMNYAIIQESNRKIENMKVTTKHEKTDFGDVWHMSSIPKDIFRFAIYRYDDDKDTVYLSNVFVDNAHRKQGLGNSILNTADKVAKKLKANTICLKVKQDTFVHKWYGRHGYSDLSVDEEEPQFIWMAKNIGE